MLKRFIAVALVLMCSITKAETVLESGSLSILKDIQHNIKGLDSEQRVKLITAMFLGTPYNDRTLNSHDSEKESLVVNLKSMDCMTFIEYTEALKQSDNYDDFISNLKKTRYREENIAYITRRHFFTDWLLAADEAMSDMTQEISPHTIQVHKHLNQKGNGQLLIQGLPVTSRTISYIPTQYIDEAVLKKLQTGDYIGIYSNKPELDVSHVGIAIREGNKIYFRNASSLKLNLKVVDVELNRYLQDKVGIIVIRSKGVNFG
ncbi:MULTISPECIES: N-acetylmuramoyl-L-alanine amidase-like domain-containing protein [Providencia]|nr:MULTISPECIES: N-acetylmuramoyl-L-alanine amidase-like domain-containing protein [Providencia]WBA56741.1 DUF1460 domain-containing protein [Providencia sp. 21OH12SH02B-Prov]